MYSRHFLKNAIEKTKKKLDKVWFITHQMPATKKFLKICFKKNLC